MSDLIKMYAQKLERLDKTVENFKFFTRLLILVNFTLINIHFIFNSINYLKI